MENEITKSSIDEAINYLQSIQVNTNLTINNIIDAQIQVIKFIQTTELVNGAFDTFFFKIELAVQNSSDSEKETILNQARSICTNFIFFSKARLEYKKVVLKEEEYKLITEKYEAMAEAANALLNGIKEVVIAVIKYEKGGNPFDNPKELINKILEPCSKKGGFVDKLCHWFQGDEILKKKKKEYENEKLQFEKMLINFVDKLYRYRNLLGKSGLISGLIENYKDILITKPASKLYSECNKRVETTKNSCEDAFSNILVTTFAVDILLGIVALLILITYWISLIFTDGIFLWGIFTKYVSWWIYAAYFTGVGITSAFFYWTFSQIKINKAKKQAENTIWSFCNKYNEIYKTFHPYSDNLYDVDKVAKEVHELTYRELEQL